MSIGRKPRALVCALLVVPVLAGAADDAYRREDALGLEARVPVPPSWIRARDGVHALYELHIANLRRHDLRLEKIEILDDASGRVLDALAGDRLAQATARRGWSGPDERKLQVDGGQHAIVFVELVLPTGVPRPSSLKHRIYASAVAGAGADRSPAAGRRWLLETLPVRFGSPPLELAAPLRGPGWLAGNALSNDSDHRRAIIPINGRATISQRYAIDWVRIGKDGRLAPAGASDNSSYYGYDEPVYAVADGHVVATRDGIPENVPFAESMAVPVTLETIAGNYVVLDLGGACAMYAHLRPGTLMVRPGDAVRRGQVLGHVGNSGQSDAPHLHFHVSDTPASLAGEGLSYVLDRFTFRGNVGNVDDWIRSQAPWQPSAQSADPRAGELPLDGDVVDLPR